MGEPPLDAMQSAQMLEISREEILKQIFGDVGELIDDFTCAVESTVLLHGRLYVTSKYICFYSNLFGLEKKIRIPYSHIKSITKENTAMVIPNAISIATDKRSYIFRSFWDRDDCHRMLSLFLQRFNAHEPIRGADYSLASRTSFSSVPTPTPADPAVQSSSTNTGTASNQPAQDSKLDLTMQEPVIRDRRSRAYSSAPLAASDSNKRQSTRVTEPDLVATAQTTTAAGETSNDNSSARRGSVRLDANGLQITDDVMDYETGFREQCVSGRFDSNMPLKYEQELQKVRLKISVVQDFALNVSLDEFFQLFIAEDAPYSFKAYHESVKDTNLVITPWEAMAQNMGYGREMRFFKPVNLPGLASTRGVKVQRYMRFGDAGLFVCSSTRLEDVPAADAFSVDDVIAARVNEDGKVVIEITFQVSFIKSTFMKYIIESSTNTEMTKWLKTFAQHMKTVSDAARANGNLSSSPSGKSSTVSAVAADTTPSVTAVAATNDKGNGSSTATATATVLASPPQPAGSLHDVIVWSCLLILAVFLVLNYWRWCGVQNKVDALEQRIEHLEQALKALRK